MSHVNAAMMAAKKAGEAVTQWPRGVLEDQAVARQVDGGKGKGRYAEPKCDVYCVIGRALAYLFKYGGQTLTKDKNGNVKMKNFKSSGLWL